MTSRPSRAIAPLTTLAALLAAAASATAQEPSPAAARLKADVTYLADDAREGRAPGTPGIEAAAGYIADAFKAAGLKPAAGADGYFQPFAIRGEPRLVGEPSLALAGPEGKRLEARPKVDFTPLVIGGAGTPEALPVVFAGYGITAKGGSDGLDYDDYDGLDVTGKAVLVLRHAPRQEEPDTPFHGQKGLNFASFRHKARNAAGHGAKAVLMVNDKAGLKGKPDELVPFEAAGPPGARIPFLMVTRDFAERLLAASGLPGLDELEAAQVADKTPPKGRPLEGWTLAARVEIERASIAAKNVVGVLEGSGPHADETVVVGAHYDHLGHGGPGSLAFGSREIHNGADDNASGTALVMELARRLGHRADPPPRRVVFMAFSGEEMGLLGSAHYVAKPLYPLRDTVMMLNFDMVGRLGEKGELSVYGTTSAPGLDPLVDALGRDEGLTIRKSGGALLGDRFSLASDHASFLLRRIPYLFFFTGVHRDYHRPSDDVEAINFPGMARVADLGELVILDVVRRPSRPEFLAAPAPPPRRRRSRLEGPGPGPRRFTEYRLFRLDSRLQRQRTGRRRQALRRPRGGPGREGRGPGGGRRRQVRRRADRDPGGLHRGHRPPQARRGGRGGREARRQGRAPQGHPRLTRRGRQVSRPGAPCQENRPTYTRREWGCLPSPAPPGSGPG